MFKQVIEDTRARHEQLQKDINKCMKNRVEDFIKELSEMQRSKLLYDGEVEAINWPIIPGSCGGEYVGAIGEIKRTFENPHDFMQNALEIGANTVLDNGETAKITLAEDMETFSIKFTVKHKLV